MLKFAIREVGTQNYMPEKAPGKTSGYSRDEPVHEGGKFGPRLLASQTAANKVIGNWRQGYHFLDRSGYGEDYEEILSVRNKPERESIKLEVVAFTLVESVRVM